MRLQRWGVTLDAPDASALAHLYADLLGWRVFDDSAATTSTRQWRTH